MIANLYSRDSTLLILLRLKWALYAQHSMQEEDVVIY